MTGEKRDGLISGERHLSKAELNDRAARVANGFMQLGVGRGDSIAMFLRNDFAFFEASLAAQRLAAYAVPINWHFKAEEVEYILGDCGAKVFIVHADLWPVVSQIAPKDVRVFVVPTPAEIAEAYGVPPDARRVPAGMQEWDEWVASLAPVNDLPPPATDSMIYTSGTTGSPKAVRRNPATPAQMAKSLSIRQTVYGFAPDMVAAVPGPLYHSAPNSFGLRASQMGRAVVLLPRFDPEGMLQAIEQHRISHMFMVPTMFVRLLKLPKAVRERYDLSSLRFIIHAAAPCPIEAKKGMIEWWGPIIHEFYGSTESSAVTLATSADSLKKPGTVGRPVEGAEIVIVGDDGKDAPVGAQGEIFTRIAGLPDFTYYNKPDKRAEIDRNGLINLAVVARARIGRQLFPARHSRVPGCALGGVGAATEVLERGVVGCDQTGAGAAFDRHIKYRHALIHIQRANGAAGVFEHTARAAAHADLGNESQEPVRISERRVAVRKATIEQFLRAFVMAELGER